MQHFLVITLQVSGLLATVTTKHAFDCFDMGVWCGGFAATFSLLLAKVYY
jgi:hypothetical protein